MRTNSSTGGIGSGSRHDAAARSLRWAMRLSALRLGRLLIDYSHRTEPHARAAAAVCADMRQPGRSSVMRPSWKRWKSTEHSGAAPSAQPSLAR